VKVLSQPVYGRITNYRIGIKTQLSRECLVQFTDINTAAGAGQLMNRKVIWNGEKKPFIGKIVGFHGKNGAVRVRFKKGVPGQALGAQVELVSQ
jgi:large subunit ribosomal protein L35Ae